MAVAQISPSGFTIYVHPDVDHVRVAPVGELDMATADLVHDEVTHLWRSGVEHVACDLSRVSFMDGQGVALLILLRNDARSRRRRLTVVPGPPPVQRVFALTGTRALFDWA